MDIEEEGGCLMLLILGCAALALIGVLLAFLLGWLP